MLRPRLLKQRLLVAAGAVLAGIALVEAALWTKLADGEFRGWPVPPYGRFDGPATREVLEERLARLETSDAAAEGFDAELGWRNVPGVTRGPSGETRTIDASGARTRRAYAPEPPPGVLRLACFGDSFTFGSEVGDEDCWPARLEAGAPALEVLNLGVPGYGTDQALLLFRREGLRGARVVVVGLLVENLCRNVSRLRSLYQPAESPIPVVKPRFVLREGELELLPQPYTSALEVTRAALAGELTPRLSVDDHWAGDAPLVPFSSIARAWATVHARARRNGMQLLFEAGEPYEVTLALLERFASEAREDGAEHALVLVFPTVGDVRTLRAKGEPEWYWRLERGLVARGVEVLDLTRPILAREDVDALYSGGGHFSPAGNALVAAQLRGWLEERYPDPTGTSR